MGQTFTDYNTRQDKQFLHKQSMSISAHSVKNILYLIMRWTRIFFHKLQGLERLEGLQSGITNLGFPLKDGFRIFEKKDQLNSIHKVDVQIITVFCNDFLFCCRLKKNIYICYTCNQAIHAALVLYWKKKKKQPI